MTLPLPCHPQSDAQDKLLDNGIVPLFSSSAASNDASTVHMSNTIRPESHRKVSYFGVKHLIISIHNG